jgi:hypothetical protein
LDSASRNSATDLPEKSPATPAAERAELRAERAEDFAAVVERLADVLAREAGRLAALLAPDFAPEADAFAAVPADEAAERADVAERFADVLADEAERFAAPFFAAVERDAVERDALLLRELDDDLAVDRAAGLAAGLRVVDLLLDFDVDEDFLGCGIRLLPGPGRRRAYPRACSLKRTSRPGRSPQVARPPRAGRCRHSTMGRVVLLCLLVVALPASAAAKLVNPADALVAEPMDAWSYDRAEGCRHKVQPGTRALERWLAAHWRGTSWGTESCRKLGPRDYSLHAEGRALDWHLDVRVAADRRAAEKLIDLLLAPDAAGNPHALATRMGIQEIIWDCRSWWGGDGMARYPVCYGKRGKPKRVDDTTAHRDHVHLGLHWAGAKKKTSFWR